MRRHLIALCIASSALATPTADKADKKLKPIDMKGVLDKVQVFRDDLGSYYVVPTVSQFSDTDAANEYVFFGDGKALYRQRIVGFGSEPNGKHEWNLWSPRVKKMQTAALELVDGKLTLHCAPKEQRALTALKADEVKQLFAKAQFFPPLWQRQTKLLARDDDGVYYFVDEYREEYGGNGYRVFVGMKGALKELPMTNVVSDSGGEIYATKTGQLKMIASNQKGPDAGKVMWIKGGKKTDLTVLEPLENRYLIYRELGIYGAIGAVCDDL